MNDGLSEDRAAPWLTTGQVAQKIGRSVDAVRQLLENERFVYFDGAYRLPGGHWRIPESAVDAFLERMSNAASTVKRRRTPREKQIED